ncbi:MAG: RsmE family RNA methyltransferase [Kofleriaceae bacterium]
MNLLLVEPGELAGDVVTIADRRGEHLRGVLGATVGSRVRCGIVGGGVGTADVLAIDDTRFTLRLAITDPAPAPMPVELVLAMPRPKVLSRAIEAAASFGVERIDLTNAWRVDKSYLDSPRLEPEALALAARFGAEQGATTHVPPIAVHRRLMELMERYKAGDGRTRSDAEGGAKSINEPGRDRLLAHPGGIPIERAVRSNPITLAIGPEGGWIEREVETFAARGFAIVSLGTPILRVETAVAAALGQLALLERVRSR